MIMKRRPIEFCLLLATFATLAGCGPNPYGVARMSPQTLPEQKQSIESRTNSDAKSATLGFDGYGQVKIGMTIEQAARALGRSLVKYKEVNDCAFFKPNGGPPGLSFTVIDGRIRIAEVRDNQAIATQNGIHVGSTLGEIRRAYSRNHMREVKNPYEDGGLILYVQELSGIHKATEIVFSIVKDKVIGIETGDFSGMGEIERCA